MKFLTAAIFILFLSACFNPPDCIITATNEVKIALKSKKTKLDTALNFTSVSVSGTSTLFYENQKTFSLQLPLNSQAAQTKFILKYEGKKDSIVFSYSTINAILSPDCGGFVYYTSLVADTTSFPDAVVVNNQLSTKAKSNVEIKF